MMDDWLNDRFDLDHDGHLSPMEHALKDDFRNRMLQDENPVSGSSDDSDTEYSEMGSSQSSSSQFKQKLDREMQQYMAEREAAEKASRIAGGIGGLLIIIGCAVINNGNGITGIYVFGFIVLLVGILFLVAAYNITH